MTKKKIEEFLLNHPGYLKKSPILVLQRLSDLYKENVYAKDLEAVKGVQKHVRSLDKYAPEILFEYKEKTIKRLFFDIEVSPNLVFSWNVGNKINLTPDNIVKERAIICISYKWEHESKVHTLTWNNGDDYKMLVDFSKVLSQADEVVGHNSNSFDIKWINGRALKYDLVLPQQYKKVDTLSIARSKFRLNSNKLNYIGQYLGVGEKINTSYDLWTKIVLSNDKQALKDMVKYCEQDVNLLEQVYNKLIKYKK